MNATPVKGGGELRPAGTAEGQAHTSLSGNNLYQFDLFSFICFNFKPKFYCSILSRCSRVPASLSWPGVPLVSQGWTFREKVLTVVSLGVGAGYSHSNTSHKNDVLPCASACRRIIIFTDQMERQAHFRLLTLYYRHFPFWPHLLQPESDQMKSLLWRLYYWASRTNSSSFIFIDTKDLGGHF